MTEIKTVTSESLQQTFRDLLPSQAGFGEDLQATNLITPIIDLTPTAEGSALPDYLQKAISRGNITSGSVSNTDTNVLSTSGFYLFNLAIALNGSANSSFYITDGSTAKTVQYWTRATDANNFNVSYIIFLASGEEAHLSTSSVNYYIAYSYIPLADANGTLTDPSGYSPA